MKKNIIIFLSLLITGCLLLIQQEAIKEYYNLSNFNFLSENIKINELEENKILFLNTFSQPNFETVASSFNTILDNNLKSEFPSIFVSQTIKYNIDSLDNYSDLNYSIINNSLLQAEQLKLLASKMNQRYISYVYFKYYGVISTENLTLYTSSFGNLPFSYDSRAIILSFRIWDAKQSKLIFDKEINYMSADFGQDNKLYFKFAVKNILNSIYMLNYDRKTQLIFNSICNEYHIVSLSDVEYLFKKIGGASKRNNIDCIFYLDDKAQYCPIDEENLSDYYKSEIRRMIQNSDIFLRGYVNE